MIARICIQTTSCIRSRAIFASLQLSKCRDASLAKGRVSPCVVVGERGDPRHGFVRLRKIPFFPDRVPNIYFLRVNLSMCIMIHIDTGFVSHAVPCLAVYALSSSVSDNPLTRTMFFVTLSALVNMRPSSLSAAEVDAKHRDVGGVVDLCSCTRQAFFMSLTIDSTAQYSSSTSMISIV